MTIIERTAAEAAVLPAQALAVKKLLDDGCTVPFIARYRKEAHGNLDEVKIAKIQERLVYYGELEERKASILKSIDEQGKLTDELKAQIEECFVKSRLEDLYQPYKPKRRTRAQVAKEKGYTNLVHFLDDGISGVTMDRPGFVDMIRQLEEGRAAAVFVKDLSRLGRNYIEVGRLTEEFFPEHDIRLVAVSDNIDTAEESEE